MYRLVIIHRDRMLFVKEKHQLLIGSDDRVQHVLSETVEREGHGYQLQLDVSLPSEQTVYMDMGVPASLTFIIDGDETIDQSIDLETVRLLKHLFDIRTRAKNVSETVISQVTAVSASKYLSSADRKLHLALVFPELAHCFRIALAQVQERLPELSIEMSEAINVTQVMDASLDERQLRQLQTLQDLMTLQLTSPYHPEEELIAREHYYERLKESWPTTNAPHSEEMDNLRTIVHGQQASVTRVLLPAHTSASGLTPSRQRSDLIAGQP